LASAFALGRASAELPPGFEETVVLAGLPATSMAWAPDGDLFLATRTREVWIRRAGTLILAGTIPGSAEGEHSINGMAVDPDYALNHHLWVYYTSPAPARNRLSRFTVSSDALSGEVVMLETPVLENTIHTGGCLQFAADRTLFLATGDDGRGSVTAQNPFDLRGKVLRVDRNGVAPSDNPFANGVAADGRVWALGFRNPYRCNLQPGTGNLFVGDVGAGSWEEIDNVIAGGNFGWAMVEGSQPPGRSGVIYPIYAYPHVSGESFAVIGGDHAPASFAPGMEGDYFFGDFGAHRLHRMRLDASNQPLSVEEWATEVPGPVDIRFGPDGALWYLAWEASQLRRIRYVGGANRQPVVIAVATPDNGPAPLYVLLDGSASSDPDGDALSHLWDLGDGQSSSAATTIHTYPAGAYNARLTVDDGHGGTAVSPPLRIVAGNRRPSVTVLQPQPGTPFNAGQSVSFAGQAVDIEDGTIPCASWAWSVVFHHLDHAHPYLGPIQGVCSGQFVTALRGETSPAVSYEIRLEARDTGAPLGAVGQLTGTASVQIAPNVGSFRLETAPRPDLALTLDTQPVAPPLAVDGVVGLLRSIGAPDAQWRVDGHTYRWLTWSDGGAREHEIATPSSPTTFRATFGCDVLSPVSNVVAVPSGNAVQLSWSAVSDPCLAGGSARYRIFAGSQPLPAATPCDFPVNPPFHLVSSTGTESLLYTPSVGEAFFAVVAVGTDGRDGPVRCTDRDADGSIDGTDNCLGIANPAQADIDGDGRGDACDNCPAAANAGQSDADGDGLGDACDACPGDATNDVDADGICGAADLCPTVPDPAQSDTDADGVGDACDGCPIDHDPGQSDADGDGLGDACDPCTDTDLDGAGDPGQPNPGCAPDNCPLTPNPTQADADGDGQGNACDPCTDTDGDGIGDPAISLLGCGEDNCPQVANPNQLDADQDLRGDVCDACPFDFLNDADADGVCGDIDDCLSVPDPLQSDVDGDGLGDACDNCPNTPSLVQTDVDHDGVGDVCDLCGSVFDPEQADTDGDGRGDRCDNCPDVSNPTQASRDGDPFGDVCDNCPDVYSSGQPDRDQDGAGDRCDLDDGMIEILLGDADAVLWQAEVGYFGWNLYRGNLALLRTFGLYTQAPGSDPLAGRLCGLASTSATVPLVPGVGQVAFWLVTGVSAQGESSLGTDSQGIERLNANPCP